MTGPYRTQLPSTRKLDYADASGYPLEPEKRLRLFQDQTECALVWNTTDGWPVGVMHRFVWHDDQFWITATEGRKRTPALRSRPKSCVIISGEGVHPEWRDTTVTAKTLATVRQSDPDLTSWFYPALARRMGATSERAIDTVVNRLDTPDRVIFQLEVTKWISTDGEKVMAHTKGEWAPGEPWP